MRDALDLLDDLCAACLPVAVGVRWRPQSPDAGDDLVIEAAVNGVADVIATYNLRDLRAPAARFLCAMGQEIAEYSGRRRGCLRRATCPGPVSTSPRLDHRRAEGADAALVPRRRAGLDR